MVNFELRTDLNIHVPSPYQSLSLVLLSDVYSTLCVGSACQVRGHCTG